MRHDAAWGMVYSPNPPYEILQTKLMDFATIQRLRRFSRYWDLYSNSGNFPESLPMLWDGASPFDRFLQFSDWLYAKLGRNHAIALQELAKIAGDEIRLALVADQLGALGLEIGDADEVDLRMTRGDFAAEQADAAGADDGEADSLGRLTQRRAATA